MDNKENHRKVLRTTFSKAAKELEDLLKDQKGEVRQIKISLDLLRQKMDDLRRIDEEIYDLLLNEDASEQDLLKEIEDSDSYIREFADLSIQFEERVQPRIAASVEDEVASGTTGKSTGSLQENAHESSQCFKAQKLTYDQRVNILTEKGACFRCLKIGHQSRRCRGQLSCLLCHKPHVPLMCREFLMGKAKKEEENKIENDGQAVTKINQSLANSATTNVFLQTLRVKMNHLGKTRVVRALIDTGSQKTYILRSTARLLDYPCKRQINLVHGLFGGSELAQKHDCYDVNLSYNNYSCTFEALDQPVICSDISSVFNGPWMEELKRLNIEITDSGDTSPIEVLIGADIAGKLYTGRRHILGCELVAVETLLGWTLMGKIPLDQQDNRTATTVSRFISNASISQLWELDALGINDPAERKTREETALAAKQLFFETVATDSTGRYETRLPWLEGHPALPSNYQMAKKRLDTTLKKINKDGYLEAYGQIFKEWLDENIIEEVFEEQPNRGQYLPHRPVIKPNSASTKIRPVFDASAKEKDKPSLNQCLEKGVNLIELIPAILLRFR
ncbi:uncharacterized protein LOC126883584 [Diabrotica virgifera virgifera]|uniref:CCHC-type domain-containing protein n=1 Tax=Diabrotica virgifera virgifera TaxID=50390 RepID=A0ABM5K4S5_DIAVI|nr:uncharacterized protein LOC126883584 [Diabrotica virgifera virgifera]